MFYEPAAQALISLRGGFHSRAIFFGKTQASPWLAGLRCSAQSLIEAEKFGWNSQTVSGADLMLNFKAQRITMRRRQ